MHTLIIGGGPAGLAPLIYAYRKGLLPELAKAGLMVIEQSSTVGSGTLGRYAINSDTLTETFLECLEGSEAGALASLWKKDITQSIATHRGGPVRLEKIATFLEALGTKIQHEVEALGGQVFTDTQVEKIQQLQDKSWQIFLKHLPGGTLSTVCALNVVVATGGKQTAEQLEQVNIGGQPLIQKYVDKLLLSDAVLKSGGTQLIRERLQDIENPKVAIVGGSHSALACANILLQRLPDLLSDSHCISLLHRRPLRIFYSSAATADQEGYLEYGTEDICPKTGRVFRLAGFRLEARELVMRVRQIGNRPPEPRLQLYDLSSAGNSEIHLILEKANLVITALGYRPRGIPLFDALGNQIPLLSHTSNNARLVDAQCRILDANEIPISGLFGIGLAAGFIPQGNIGGEPSFQGQTNGLWLWQNDIGSLIIQNLLIQD